MLQTIVSNTTVVTPTCFYALLSVEGEVDESVLSGSAYLKEEYLMCLIVTVENNCLDLYVLI